VFSNLYENVGTPSNGHGVGDSLSISVIFVLTSMSVSFDFTAFSLLWFRYLWRCMFISLLSARTDDTATRPGWTSERVDDR
jgi:hypothetical protein